MTTKKLLFMQMIILLILPIKAKNRFIEGDTGENKFIEKKGNLYRGWIWFEEPENRPEKQQKEQEKQQDDPVRKNMPSQTEIDNARARVKQLSKDLDDLHYLMIDDPENAEYIKMYQLKYEEMMAKAFTLGINYRNVHYFHPDIANELDKPQNMYARAIYSDQEERAMHEKTKEFAKKAELFIFIQQNCDHCEKLEKHLNTFASDYGFEVTAISVDNGKSRYFNTHHDYKKEIANRLNLSVTPSVIAVTKDRKHRFELARGAVSVSEMESRSEVFYDYLQGNIQLKGEGDES